MILDEANSSDNPFITRHVRPGAIGFLFPEGTTAESLIDRLAGQQWWGEMVGPHGSGKSTLLQSLLPIMPSRDRQVEIFELRQGQRRLSVDASATRHWTADTQIVVDGYEQLGWMARMWLRRYCRKRGAGLLVTAHRSVGFQTLFRTEPSLATAQAVVDQLLQGRCDRITQQDVERCFRRNQGDLRETLFSLYDLYGERGT